MTLTAEQARQKTREMFDLNDDEDLSYITEAFLSEDANELPGDAALDFPRIQFGSRMSYGYRDGYGNTYEYFAGVALPNYPDSSGEACGGQRWFAAQSQWDHDNLGEYCGGSGQPAYRRTFKLTFRG